MTTVIQDTDYKNLFFEHPELSKIVDEPNASNLITIRNQVKDNAMSVHTIVGGGQHGHLGLVVTPVQYAAIPGTQPYVKPQHPGALAIPNNATQFIIINLRDQHQEALRLFREVTAVERVLIQQIVQAVHPKYLKAIRNAITNRINKTIPEIFQHLFDTYGDISTEDLYIHRTRLESLRFDANEPVDTVFTEVEEYEQLCELANSPLSDKQKIDHAYVIILKTLKYKSTLKEWNKLPQEQATWPEFKKLFRNAQRAMRKTGELGVNEGLNHTELINVVSEGVKQAITENTPEPQTVLEQANAVNDENMWLNQMAQLQEQMNQIQQMFLASKQPPVQQTHQQGWQNCMPPQQQVMQQQPLTNITHTMHNQNNQQQANIPRYPNDEPKRFNRYCWTHGACAHRGKRCKHKADGHQDEATFTNKMGGSTHMCWN